GGLRYETPEDNGLTALLSRVLSRGAGDLGAHAFTEELDLLSASISATAGRSSMSVRGDFLARHFTRSFELFASCLTAPRLDVEEVERERQLQLQHIRNRDDRPTGLAFHQFGRALWTRHPYRLHPHGEERPSPRSPGRPSPTTTAPGCARTSWCWRSWGMSTRSEE